MEILQKLISSLLNGENADGFSQILKLLSENNFDVKKVLSRINPQALIPLLLKFIESAKPNNASMVNTGAGLSPIASIADKEIIYSLNRYFSD